LLISGLMPSSVPLERCVRSASLALVLAACSNAPSPRPSQIAVETEVPVVPGPDTDVARPNGIGQGPVPAGCTPSERDWLRSAPGELSLSQLDYAIPDAYTTAPLRLAVAGARWAVAGTVEVGVSTRTQAGDWMDAAVTTFEGFTPLAHRQFGGDDTDQFDQSFALQITDDGYYLGGQFCTSLPFEPPIAGQGEQDAFLVALSAQAEPEAGSSFTLGGPGRNERVTGLAVTVDGAVYAAGQLQPGAVAAGQALDIPQTGGFYLARTEHGQLAWIHTWPGEFDGPQIAALSDGSVVVGSPGAQPFLRRYSAAGELDWEAPLGPSLSLRAITVDARDQITAVGIHRSGFDVRALGGERFCPSPEFGAYAVQLSAEGDLRWARSWSTPTDGGVNGAAVVAFGGGVAVTGYYGMHSDSRASRAIFGYLRAFADDGQEIGQLIAEAGTIIPDLAVAGDQLRLLLRPFGGAAAGVVDVPVSALLR
jgi:outer membrane protein assembly factor BamB